ncbi:MAG: zinc ribbon-containing protein [Methanobrevibacter sp.]|nr:zinc ribbon-containing protein [Methanobrevibacter sp.]
MDNMYFSGDHSGKGRYVCTDCYKALYLEDNCDTIPFCPECGNQQFIAR